MLLKSPVMMHPLDDLYQTAKNHPFYKHILSNTRDFSQVPILDKHTLYRNIEQAFQDPEFLEGLYISPSGGSGANPVLYFPTDISENRLQRNIFARCLTRANILNSQTIALNLFWNGTIMYRSLEIFNDLCEYAHATSLPVSSLCSDTDALTIARRFKANTLVGYTTRLMQFARHIKQDNLQIHFDHIIFAGEPMLSHQKQFLTQVLGTTKFSSFYGSAETGVWGYQPPELNTNCYLYSPELMYVEIINPDLEGFGNIITTNLVRWRNPLLRYNTGDIGRIIEVLYEGKYRKALELKGRIPASFDIGGDYYHLYEFDDISQDFMNVQFQLSYDEIDQKDKIKICLVPISYRTSKDEQKHWIEKFRKILNSNDQEFITEIAFVEPHQLIKSPSSQKVLKIVDYRS